MGTSPENPPRSTKAYKGRFWVSLFSTGLIVIVGHLETPVVAAGVFLVSATFPVSAGELTGTEMVGG
jgi:hypothetical protein